MLEVLKAIAMSGSFRRFLVFVLTAAAAFVHRKWGFEIEPQTIDMLIGLAMVYIGGGNLKDAIVTRAKSLEAKAPSMTLQEAVDELKKPLAEPK